MLLPLHVAAGGLAIVLGAVALSVKKGGAIHRHSGLWFVYAMLVMAVSASILSLLEGKADGNVLASVLTAYFVGTALTTVRPASSWTRRVNAGALTVAVVLAFGCALGGVRMIGAPGRDANGVPFQTAGAMSLIVAALLVLAAVGDVRIMRSGMPRGGPRLARHLWRMCFALFIAVGSFVSVRERVAILLPEPLTTGPMRALPILLLFGAMFYWLWRVKAPALHRQPADETEPPVVLHAHGLQVAGGLNQRVHGRRSLANSRCCSIRSALRPQQVLEGLVTTERCEHWVAVQPDAEA